MGIVVVPGTHGVLKDGTGSVNQCGIMSIVPMSYSTPASGGNDEQATDVFIYWGKYNTDIRYMADGLGRYDSVTDGLQNYYDEFYIPEQTNVNSIPLTYGNPRSNPYADTDTSLSNERNSDYGVSGCISDFKGIVNTKILTDNSGYQSDWRTASSIINNSGVECAPAACCCARFKTPGTKAFVECSVEELRNGTGFWYLPAAGEMGYILPRWADINDTISKLNSAYGIGVQLTKPNYWSSTEGDTVGSYALRKQVVHESYVGRNNKALEGIVHAFMCL